MLHLRLLLIGNSRKRVVGDMQAQEWCVYLQVRTKGERADRVCAYGEVLNLKILLICESRKKMT